MPSPRVLAVDIGAGHVACGVFTTGAAGRLVLQQFAVEAHSSDPAHEARWGTELAQSLGAVGARYRLSGNATLGIPGHLALTKLIKTPSLAKEKRRKIVEFEAAENIPYPLNEVVWDHLVLADDGYDLEVMLAAAKLDAMQGLCAAADAAGFAAVGAVPAGVALGRAFRYNYPQTTGSVIVANIGARTTNLVFIEGDRFYVRTVAYAGNNVTLFIADELRLDFVQAEALKIEVMTGRSDLPPGSTSRAAVHNAMAAFVTRLGLEITRSVVNQRRHTGGAAPTALYITGGGSLIPELPEALAEKVKLQVERYEPLRNVDLSANARAAGAESAAHILADLVGLATRLTVADEAEVSLLPPEVVERIGFQKRQPLLMVAAMLGVLILAPPIYYFHQLTTLTQAKISAVDDQLRPLHSIQTRNDDNLRQIEDAKKQIAALQGAYETKANWINFFTDLQNRLVKIEDVWLDRVQVVRPELAPPGETPADQPPPTPPPADANATAADAPKGPPLRLTLSGRLLDVANPQSKVSPESFERVKQLLTSFAGSQFISAVENEKFDNNQNGLLRFDFTLVINPKKTL